MCKCVVLFVGSLSVVSNTTDSSTKKPADGMENIEVSSLPEYGARPIDTWRTSQDHNNTHVGFDSLDYPNPSDPKVTLTIYCFAIQD